MRLTFQITVMEEFAGAPAPFVLSIVAAARQSGKLCQIVASSNLTVQPRRVLSQRPTTAYSSGCTDQRKLHSPSHWIDALGAYAYAIAVLPDELLRFCPATSPRSALTLVAAWHRHYRVVAFAIHATRACGFLQCVDRQQALDKHLEQLHETSKLLH